MQAIVNGEIWTMHGARVPRGTVLFENGKIAAVGENMAVPSGADIYDAAGMIVMPGFIDAHTHLGILEEIFEEGDDLNETTDPITPHLRAIDAINPMDMGFQDALAAGITTVVTGPGSANILGGEMVAMKTCGTVVDDMVICCPVGLKAALGENPKRVYGPNKKTPVTRMASAALLRDALARGLQYLEKQARARRGEADPPERDLKMESVARVLCREIPLRVHAHRADDIMTALRIGHEFNLRLVIEHCTEGHLVADRLAAAGVPAVVGPVLINRSKVELMGRSLKTAAALARQGVSFAIMTDHPVVPIQYLPISAGLTTRGGLSEEQALGAITIGAARVLGLEDRIGSIATGKDADVVVLSGHPFYLGTVVNRVYVGGKVIDVNN
ncbi:amidohydrolase [Desulfoscipio gibsoniae]|uniref:Amidohydrolase, imidazolonepropionase n=1 Tax=Desulfoscipio gibsoniae DSM 7213 TaxID=767817 RepID=R4KJI0_9FIRM|nr:amidohydrolase [Desulfoscipio gibsoniae]AGL01772.1 amidohydrolase, imidazolonepropionase [Desulfoscipio gibsoniae DSM 7213]